MKNSKSVKIWKDVHLFRIFLLISLSLISVLFIYAIITNIKANNINMFYFILLITPILFLILTLRNRLTYVTFDGVRIGNTVSHTYDKIKLPKTKFLFWREIKEIVIINRQVTQGFMLVIKPFLIIKSKEGKKYESFIANPNGLVKTLKEIKKNNLISKDSKYK